MLKRWIIGTIVISILLIFIALHQNQLLIIEFIFGMLIAFIYEKKEQQAKTSKSNIVGSSLLAFGMTLYFLWFFNSEILTEWDRLFKWGIPALFIVAGALYAKQIHNKTVELLGDASYSIYLVQVFSIPVFYKIAKVLMPNWNGDVIAFLALLFSITTGVITYLIIEKPMTNFLRKKLIKQRECM